MRIMVLKPSYLYKVKIKALWAPEEEIEARATAAYQRVREKWIRGHSGQPFPPTDGLVAALLTRYPDWDRAKALTFLQKHRIDSLDQLIASLVKEEIPHRYEAYLKKARAKPKSVFREYAEAIAVAVILALFIRTFVVQAFKIPSGSMLPTLQIGDHILVNKFLYYFREPRRGDIIVFKFPLDEGRDFIKRVVGLPGETLEIRGKQVYINGKPLDEPYAVHLDANILSNPHSPRDHFGPVKIPPGHLFVMGDNRDHSMDSRFWGFLDIRKVKGEAFLIYWSWDRERHWPRFERIGHLVR